MSETHIAVWQRHACLCAQFQPVERDLEGLLLYGRVGACVCVSRNVPYHAPKLPCLVKSASTASYTAWGGNSRTSVPALTIATTIVTGACKPDSRAHYRAFDENRRLLANSPALSRSLCPATCCLMNASYPFMVMVA